MNKVLKGLVAVAASAAMAIAGVAGASTAMAEENTTATTNPTITFPTDTKYQDHTYEVYQIFTGDLSDGVLSNVKYGENGAKTKGTEVTAAELKQLTDVNVEGKTEEELLAGFHQKWRYNIRLAQRKGVSVRICGKEMVPAFSELMLTTGVRDGFVTRQPEYFANMLDNLGEHARLYMAFDPEGTPIAGTLAIHYGDKVWYLYGASSNEHRNLMPNYLLQWRMIQWAVETGCSVYDFRGVSGDISEDNPLYGLYKFKKGFGGDFTEFVGEYDLVLKRTAWLIAEKGSVLYKNLNAKLYLLKNRKK